MLVTSFFAQRDGHTTRPIDSYLRYFNDLVNTGLPIVVFFDKNLDVPRFPSHVNLIPTDLRELDTFKLMDLKNPEVYVSDNPTKNTLDFHIIQNAKTEFCVKAAQRYDLPRVTWVDFGISHVIKNKDHLKYLVEFDRLPSGVTIPGCWNSKTNHIHEISWRFCGGVLSSDSESLKNFHIATQNIIKSIKPRITWEVNIWAVVESMGFPVNWYKANHDDTIITGVKSLLL
jgi:hypothetical protein